MKGELEKALEEVKAVIRYEPFEKKLYDSGQVNSYRRLVVDYKKGWMLCKPFEIALFNKKLKTAVMLGDFYYEIEDEEKCFKIRNALAEGKYGKLNREQIASAHYRVAEIIFRMFKIEEAKKIIKDLAENYTGTLIYPQVMIALGNLYIAGEGDENLKMAVKCYEKSLKFAKDDDIRQCAMYYLATSYRKSERIKDALKLYEKQLQEYPDGWFSNSIKTYMSILKERKK